jgi:hypothetical protein
VNAGVYILAGLALAGIVLAFRRMTHVKPSPARHRMQRDSRVWMTERARTRFENVN